MDRPIVKKKVRLLLAREEGGTMESLNILNNLRIASPCPASWETMQGDQRVRFCDSCSKHVYDIANLKAEAALALIQESEGHLCVRLYRRKDGTVLTADCPVGIRAALRRRLFRMAAAGVVLIATLRSGIWLFANSSVSVDIPPIPSGPAVTFADWGEWALAVMGRKKPVIPIMGKLAMPRTSSTCDGGSELVSADQL
jgi:hypothetical protein